MPDASTLALFAAAALALLVVPGPSVLDIVTCSAERGRGWRRWRASTSGRWSTSSPPPSGCRPSSSARPPRTRWSSTRAPRTCSPWASAACSTASRPTRRRPARRSPSLALGAAFIALGLCTDGAYALAAASLASRLRHTLRAKLRWTGAVDLALGASAARAGR